MVNKDEIKKYKKMQIWFVIWAIIIAFLIIDICIENSRELKPQNFNIVIILTIFGLIVPAIIVDKKYKDSLDGLSKEEPTYEFLELYDKLYRANYSTIAVLKEDARGFTKLFNTATWILLGAFFLLIVATDHLELLVTVLIILFVTKMFYLGTKRGKDERMDAYEEIYKKEVVANILKLIDYDLEYNIEPRYGSEFGVKMKEYGDSSAYKVEDEVVINLIEGKKLYYYDVAYLCRNDDETINQEPKSRGHMQFESFIPSTEEIQIYKKQQPIYGKKSEHEVDIDLFEDEINVKTTNVGYTKLLLNENLKYMLYDFLVNNNVELVIKINNSKVYMYLEIDGIFEPNIKGEILDKKTLYKYYYVIKCMTDIANEFIKSSKNIKDTKDVK